MKSLKFMPLFLIVASSIVLLLITPSTVSCAAKSIQRKIMLEVMVRDYYTERPLSNVSLIVSIHTNIGGDTFYLTTNVTGQACALWKNTRIRRIDAFLTKLSLRPTNSSPLVVIKICDTVMEDVKYNAGLYLATNETVYDNLRVPLYVIMRNDTFVIKCYIWTLTGKLVNVSSVDPSTGKTVTLSVTPGVLVSELSYEDVYLVPLNYTVYISGEISEDGYKIPVDVRILVTNSTTSIPWSSYAAKILIERKIGEIQSLAIWFKKLGYSITEELGIPQSLDAIMYLANQSLILFEVGEYEAAVSAMTSLWNSIRTTLIAVKSFEKTAIISGFLMLGIIIGFSSIITTIFLRESKFKELVSLIVFLALLFCLILFQPSIKVAMTMSLKAFGMNVGAIAPEKIPMLIILLGLVTFSIYLLVSTLFMTRGSTVGLVLQYIRARIKRRAAALFTLALTIASMITVARISISPMLQEYPHSLEPKLYGIYMVADLNKRPEGLTLADLKWLEHQLLVLDEGLITVCRPGMGYEVGIQAPIWIPVRVIGIDPEFMDRYFHISQYIIQGRFLLSGNPEILLPDTYSHIFHLNDNLTLVLIQMGSQGWTAVGPLTLIPFKIVGFYDPYTLANLTAPDGKPFFPDMLRMPVLIVPRDVLTAYMVTTQIIVLTEGPEGLSTLAKQLAVLMPFEVTAMLYDKAITYQYVSAIAVGGIKELIVLLLIGSLFTFSIMLNALEDRRRDYKILGILGASPRRMFIIMTTEALILGFLSSFIGWVIGPIVTEITKRGTEFFSSSFLRSPSFETLPISSIYIALTMGLFMTLIASLAPAMKAQVYSLMGRRKRKSITFKDLRIEGGYAKYVLPIRVSVFEASMLYKFIKEEILNPKDILKEEVFLDGTFSITFNTLPSSQRSTTVRCRLKTIRRDDSLLLELQVPQDFARYMFLGNIIYRIENKLIKYPEWKNRQIRFVVLRREAPAPIVTIDELLDVASSILKEIDDVRDKIRKLEEMKPRISIRLYSEYSEKYRRRLTSLNRRLMSIRTKLEPFYKQLKDEISKLRSELERLEIAHELNEIPRRDYEEKSRELKKKLSEYESKLLTAEKVFKYLEAPASELLKP
ncbi:MAG: FtsX-like permease family protein [Thermoprotei archaeon]|nr:FtsX-like permease family protein [Thermoprotei archaeon]